MEGRRTRSLIPSVSRQRFSQLLTYCHYLKKMRLMCIITADRDFERVLHLKMNLVNLRKQLKATTMPTFVYAATDMNYLEARLYLMHEATIA